MHNIGRYAITIQHVYVLINDSDTSYGCVMFRAKIIDSHEVNSIQVVRIGEVYVSCGSYDGYVETS